RNFNRTLAIIPTADPGPGSLLLTIPAAMLADQAGNVPPTDFTLRFTELVPSNYTLGQTVTGALARAGDTASYTFSGAVGQKIYYDALENDFTAIDATLISPSGRKLFFANSDI